MSEYVHVAELHARTHARRVSGGDQYAPPQGAGAAKLKSAKTLLIP